jgi:hypothetical protein
MVRRLRHPMSGAEFCELVGWVIQLLASTLAALISHVSRPSLGCLLAASHSRRCSPCRLTAWCTSCLYRQVELSKAACTLQIVPHRPKKVAKELPQRVAKRVAKEQIFVDLDLTV